MPSKKGTEPLHGANKTLQTLPTSSERGMVYYEKGLTKSIGSFEFARITVGLWLPLNPTRQEITDASKTIRVADNLIDKEIDEQLNALLDERTTPAKRK